MSLTPEQTAEVSTWIAAGASLSDVQKKILEHFKISMTYMDVRFLVDDLELTLKDAAPRPDASDVTKTPPPAAKPPPAPAHGDSAPAVEDDAPELMDDDLPPGGLGGNITVEVDQVTLIPGALASGSVTFSDGVVGKWIVDNYGRPGFTEVSQPGYRPSAADSQAFMQELSLALQSKGLG